MRNIVTTTVIAALAVAIVGCGGAGSTFDATANAQNDQVSSMGHIVVPDSTRPQASGVASTHHLIWASDFGPMASTGPTGLTPVQVRGAYNVTANGSGAIAIVDAYDYPTALADFNKFSTQFGLPTEPSTNQTASTNAVFQKVYASGSKPSTNASWSLEMALDIEWAHAMAPGAKIYLVEATSATLTNLIAAENVAKALTGVKEVSNSWGASEASSYYTSYDSVFTNSGVAFFASGGDTGGSKSWPALSSNVVAVGGTTLHLSGNTWSSETAWTSTGCGLSSYEARPTFQNVISTIVGTHRGADDIAAVADPNTGASVYDTTRYGGVSGWFVVGGTSLACPVIAGIANASGTNRASSQAQNTAFYAGLGGANFHDITSGQAGSYSAAAGWDYPTGVGTPKGVGGF